ncbi:MAG TPA: TraR/DksA C4-type zinc finger protein [Balneolales bacterium]|nr:TraR/DksA C4-type zinc finger protein [Balneolales bacterium]
MEKTKPDVKNNAKRITPFSDGELEHFRQLLLQKRDKAKDELETLKMSLEEHKEKQTDEPLFSHHMGDVGTDVEDLDTMYAMIDRTRKYIIELNEALERITKKTYGICQKTGKPISKERLEAVPHTRFSIEAKEGDVELDKR